MPINDSWRVDKNPSYPPAIEVLKNEDKLSIGVQTRQIKYLNDII